MVRTATSLMDHPRLGGGGLFSAFGRAGTAKAGSLFQEVKRADREAPMRGSVTGCCVLLAAATAAGAAEPPLATVESVEILARLPLKGYDPSRLRRTLHRGD
jgi:hypothetical protein